MARETQTVRIQPRIQADIDVHQWQIDHIRQGLCEANAGKFATEAEVNRAIAHEVAIRG
jgi:predicted transcriptional regulator